MNQFWQEVKSLVEVECDGTISVKPYAMICIRIKRIYDFADEELVHILLQLDETGIHGKNLRNCQILTNRKPIVTVIKV